MVITIPVHGIWAQLWTHVSWAQREAELDPRVLATGSLLPPSGPGLTQSLPSLPTCPGPLGFTIPDPNVQAPPHWGAEAKG